MGKNSYSKILIPILSIGFIVSILMSFVGIKFLSSYNNKKYNILMENFIANIKVHHGSLDMQADLIPLINEYKKEYDIAYLMVMTFDKQIIVASEKKDFGKFSKDTFYKDSLLLNHRVSRNVSIPENMLEIIEPVSVRGQKGLAIIAINTIEVLYEKILIIIVSFSVLVLLLVAGILACKSIYKINYYSFGRIDSLIQNIILLKKIEDKDYIIDVPELENSFAGLKKISEQMALFKDKINALKYDTATGLCSFQYIQEKLQYELKRSYRYARPLSCVLVEIENLKDVTFKCSVNEIDFMIKEMADLIKVSLRKVDIPGIIDRGTFIIILPEVQLHQAEIVKQRLAKIVGEYKLIHNKEKIDIIVNTSINSYSKELGEIDENAFLHQSQIALQSAKFMKYFKSNNLEK